MCVGRWKWGSSNVTGKVDEFVHEGQAQVQSNKVHYRLFLPTILNCINVAAGFVLARAILSRATPAREIQR